MAKRHPEVALALLERYFALEEHFFDADAFFNQATAYVSLGRIEKAIASFLKALRREQEFPNMRTQAWSQYALLVVSKRLQSHYEKAMQVLEERKSLLTFPVDRFLWHATYALIKEAQGSLQVAKEHATEALAAARAEHSGFRRHPTVGLVGSN